MFSTTVVTVPTVEDEEIGEDAGEDDIDDVDAAGNVGIGAVEDDMGDDVVSLLSVFAYCCCVVCDERGSSVADVVVIDTIVAGLFNEEQRG